MSRATEPAAPHWATWLDSMEGVPEWPQPAETPVERAARGSLLSRGHAAFGRDEGGGRGCCLRDGGYRGQ